jgi:transcription termination factor NusB
LKLENERLQTRLEELVEELEQARSQTNELMEQVNSRNVEEVQHEIEDIKQWEKLVDELTAEKESLKGLIQEAIQKAKSLQQRNSLFEA